MHHYKVKENIQRYRV